MEVVIKTKKFVIVCTFGAGSSLMLRMNVERVLRDLGAENCIVEVSDMGSARGKVGDVTAFLCSIVLADNLRKQIGGAPVIGVKNFYNKNELTEVLKPFLDLN